MDDRIEERRDEILRALVEEHIRTGEPVSSRAVLDATGLGVSGATIRNELSALDREGYAVQPHTSAGRVPTAKAYRYYVDHLTPTRLRASTQQRITGFYSSVQLELGRLLKATTDLLADMTHFPAVAVTPGPVGEQVRSLSVVQLGAQTALLVMVTSSGRVSQELIRIQTALTATESEEVERVVASAVVGAELGSELLPNLIGLDGRLRAAVSEVIDAVKRTERRTADVYVGGTHQMATVWDNLATVHRVLEVLEGEARMLEIFAGAAGTSIQLGTEMGMSDDVDVAVVSTSFLGGSSAGRVGVIGPMRMDYRKVISTVEGVSRELGDRIGS
jgi:heat-inducible transcriptional repressor